MAHYDADWSRSYPHHPLLQFWHRTFAVAANVSNPPMLWNTALHDRRPVQEGGLVHHSDRPSRDIARTMPCRAVGGQYLSIRYTERLAEAGIERSVGSVGDSYDNALAEAINGLYKTEPVHRQGPWRNMQDLEMATLGWVDWFNHLRLLGPIHCPAIAACSDERGNIPPAEAEGNFYAQRDVLDMVA
jgi:transposase InsO family protein